MNRYASRLLGALCVAMLVMVAGPVLAEAVPVRVDRDICAKVVAHVPDADVAYKPGVDVKGRPVAPADLPGAFQMAAPDGFVVILDLNLPPSALPRARPRGLEATVPLGLLTVQDGRVLYDGQPLEPPEQAQLAAACRDFLRRRR